MIKKANAERGQVNVSVVKGLLNLQIPSIYAKQHYDRKQQYLSFGARDTKENMIMAMQAALELQRDLEEGGFDSKDVDKYKHPSKVIGRQYNTPRREVEEVLELYDEFVSNSRVGQTTLASAYKTFRNHLVKMADQQGYRLNQQLEIKTWVEKNTAPTVCVITLAMLYRMVEWGKREERLAPEFTNKFRIYEKAYKQSLRTINTKRKAPKGVEHLMPTEEIHAWTEQERDIVIAAFHSRLGSREIIKRRGKPDHKAYLIEFLFHTGCRHGEAFALTWGDIDDELKRIRITKSYSSRCKVVKGTKTGKVRTIPANTRVQEILRTLKPNNATDDTLVFVGNTGNCLTSVMICQMWNPSGVLTVIGKLIKEGKLTRYFDAYSTRRTFVSIQIGKGVPIPTVAMWVGDKPQTILEHYAAPDFSAVPH
jgi:integrase